MRIEELPGFSGGGGGDGAARQLRRGNGGAAVECGGGDACRFRREARGGRRRCVYSVLSDAGVQRCQEPLRAALPLVGLGRRACSARCCSVPQRRSAVEGAWSLRCRDTERILREAGSQVPV